MKKINQENENQKAAVAILYQTDFRSKPVKRDTGNCILIKAHSSKNTEQSNILPPKHRNTQIGTATIRPNGTESLVPK